VFSSHNLHSSIFSATPQTMRSADQASISRQCRLTPFPTFKHVGAVRMLRWPSLARATIKEELLLRMGRGPFQGPSAADDGDSNAGAFSEASRSSLHMMRMTSAFESVGIWRCALSC
jgi:hypothetical protein